MKALSVRQPWAWAIAREAIPNAPPPKRWENREAWAKPKSRGLLAQAQALVGQTVLLHAGLGCTRAEYEEAILFMSDIGAVRVGRAGEADFSRPIPPRFADLPRGVLLATFRLAGVAFTLPCGCRTPVGAGPGAECLLCGEAWRSHQHCRERCPKADIWAVPGALGFILEDVKLLAQPIPLKGALGFFHVPEGILR